MALRLTADVLIDVVSRHPAEARTFLEKQLAKRGRARKWVRAALSWIEPPSPCTHSASGAANALEELEAAAAAWRALKKARGDSSRLVMDERMQTAFAELSIPENRPLADEIRARFEAANAKTTPTADQWADVLSGVLGIDALPDLFDATARDPARVPGLKGLWLRDMVTGNPERARSFLLQRSRAAGSLGKLAKEALSWLG